CSKRRRASVPRSFSRRSRPFRYNWRASCDDVVIGTLSPAGACARTDAGIAHAITTSTVAALRHNLSDIPHLLTRLRVRRLEEKDNREPARRFENRPERDEWPSGEDGSQRFRATCAL